MKITENYLQCIVYTVVQFLLQISTVFTVVDVLVLSFVVLTVCGHC